MSDDDSTGTQRGLRTACRQHRRFAAAAQRRLPRVLFDYVDGGADGEVTLRENTRAFEEVTFRPRNAVFVRGCELRTKFSAAI